MKKKVVALVMAVTMMAGMSMTSMAAPESAQDFKGQGYLTNQTDSGDGGMVDISISADSFLWYANADTATANPDEYEIKAADYLIVNNSEKVNLQVTLVEYKQNGANNALASLENNIELNLTRDLAADGLGQDLFNNPTYAGVYQTPLEAEDTWTFSFNGIFSGTLPSGGAVSDYVLTLEFEAVSIG